MHDNTRKSVRFHAARALLPDGWAQDVRIDSVDGRISAVTVDAAREAGDQPLGTVVAGLGNLHSHAFQRAMAGLTEVGGRSGDSFWSWRELMYRFLDRLDPDDFQAIAAQAYMEMLESGFTRVGEFHYLHHAPDGSRYADPAEMAGRVAAAAAETGLGLTLLPVFYAHSDFGGAAPTPGQRRFLHDIDGFAALLGSCRKALAATPDAVLGLAPHSLRACTPEELAALTAMAPGPIHIHIAEQTREVDACLAWSGQRPVEWLYANVPVDQRWCLVHATHVSPDEVRLMADSGAVVGLCPITEANLGDGLFPMRAFVEAGGRFGVGSDSNVLIDAAEELRLLEYGQRLSMRGRNVLSPGALSTGRWLYQQAGEGAAQVLGERSGLAVGAPADLLELDLDHPSLHGREGDALLDSWLFAARNGALRSVWRNGRELVRDGRHVNRAAIAARYRAALGRILA
ncbi:formimidoylglutamate deiminase [Stenotrophomonas sp. SY1]|uniref:formimidoylglutamate deiminase n=1 Tax=Stenotrophomonas sp. SY1 TaxID=477235 RepID=UPI001E422987|nr:formimidoylglutamate deiminase [Stenotrophomonas sp. SY1]MCD9086916.1 formimidoylglutamate deiminase [Stenotrophomonas sp. SY1]